MIVQHLPICCVLQGLAEGLGALTAGAPARLRGGAAGQGDAQAILTFLVVCCVPQGLAKGLGALTALSRLACLHLCETELKIKAMRAIGALAALTELRLAVSTVNDSGLRQVARLSALQVLDASCCAAVTPG